MGTDDQAEGGEGLNELGRGTGRGVDEHGGGGDPAATDPVREDHGGDTGRERAESEHGHLLGRPSIQLISAGVRARLQPDRWRGI